MDRASQSYLRSDRCDANHTKLEQAFSEDGGKTWETNWIYEVERLGE